MDFSTGQLRLSKKWHSHFFEGDCTKASSRSRRHKFRIIRIPINGNANSLHCSSSPIKPKVLWGPREIVGEAFTRSVISEVHAPGNDGIQFYSVAFGRRNSLQEGFFDKLEGTRRGGSLLYPDCGTRGGAQSRSCSHLRKLPVTASISNSYSVLPSRSSPS